MLIVNHGLSTVGVHELEGDVDRFLGLRGLRERRKNHNGWFVLGGEGSELEVDDLFDLVHSWSERRSGGHWCLDNRRRRGFRWGSNVAIQVHVVSTRGDLHGLVESSRLVDIHGARSFPSQSNIGTLKSAFVEIISAVNTTDWNWLIRADTMCVIRSSSTRTVGDDLISTTIGVT